MSRRYWAVSALLVLVAVLVYVLLAFEAFHGKAIDKAIYLGAASFMAAFLPLQLP